MKVSPDTTIRIANAETVSLELDVDASLTAVRLLPRFSDAVKVDLTDNAFEFPVLQTPDTVKLEWLASGSNETVFVSYVVVVSRHYFSLDALRNYGHGQDDFDQLPEEELYAARQAATEVFEEAANRSFVHTIGRTKDYGRSDLVQLQDGDVYEVLTDGYIQVSDCQLERDPFVVRQYPLWIEYLHGTDTMPAEVSRAVLELAAYTLRPSNRPIGATGESSDAGYIHFTIAGRDGATAIPEVNAAIEQFGRGNQYVW